MKIPKIPKLPEKQAETWQLKKIAAAENMVQSLQNIEASLKRIELLLVQIRNFREVD